MKITAFDELYPAITGTYGTTLGQASGSNNIFGGDVVGDSGDLSVVGLRQTVSLSSNIGGGTLGDVLTIISSSPRTAQFATPSNSIGSNSMTRTTGGQSRVTTIATAGAATTLMIGGANTFDITLTAATCTLALTGAAASGFESEILLIIRQDSTGGRLISWPGSITWAAGTAPTLATAANAVNFVILETIDAGVTWFGFVVSSTTGGTASPLTTKGDLYTYDTTNQRFAAGSNGQFIVSDPVEATGLRWTTNPAVGELLLSSTHSKPPVFGDILVNTTGDDFMYGSR